MLAVLSMFIFGFMPSVKAEGIEDNINISELSQEEIDQKLIEIENRYESGDILSDEDAAFIIAVSNRPEPYGYGPDYVTTDFTINGVVGALKENWVVYGEDPFTKQYSGKFVVNLYTNRQYAKSMDLSIKHTVYGLVGGKVGITKTYTDSARFTVDSNTMSYRASFYTKGGVALYSNTSVTIRVEKSGSSQAKTFSIKAK